MADAPVKRRATYADIEALPSNVVGEIIDGEPFEGVELDLATLWGD